jgi:hypothetical protein
MIKNVLTCPMREMYRTGRDSSWEKNYLRKRFSLYRHASEYLPEICKAGDCIVVPVTLKKIAVNPYPPSRWGTGIFSW